MAGGGEGEEEEEGREILSLTVTDWFSAQRRLGFNPGSVRVRHCTSSLKGPDSLLNSVLRFDQLPLELRGADE